MGELLTSMTYVCLVFCDTIYTTGLGEGGCAKNKINKKALDPLSCWLNYLSVNISITNSNLFIFYNCCTIPHTWQCFPRVKQANIFCSLTMGSHHYLL